jgi:general secretion pathway protein A
MYLEFYGLKEAPFSITPDPRYVFLSERHRDALAHLLYGIGKGGSGGFVQLTGEVGTGKTTLCRLLLEQLPEHTRVALVLNPKLSPVELLETICEELKLDIAGRKGSLKALVDTLNIYLLDAYAQGLRVVLIVDEAQELSTESLEQVRLLTNLETPTQKLLQIILLGQPELRDKLHQPELRQLAQRITARYHLMPLDRGESEAYVRHRLAVAGTARSPFSRLGVRALYRRSGGVPRVINVIADRALMAGFAREQDSLGEQLVDRAADETLPGNARYWLHRYRRGLAAAAVLILVVGAASWHWLHQAPAPVAEAVAKPIPPPHDDSLDSLRKAIAHTPDADLTAWTQLLGRWQVNSAQVSVRDAAHCPGVITAGFDCLHGNGTLEQLARFDRPLILTLRDGGAHVDALLLAVDAQHVKLAIGGQTRTLKKSDLAGIWTGEFSAVWGLPAGIPAKLHPGDAGAGVAWVKAQLALMDGGKADDTGPAYFDAALEDRVRKLQNAYGIKPDGIIGPETLFALSALSESGPHLYRKVE